jgi:hypothetical protein
MTQELSPRPVHHVGYWVEDLDAAVQRSIETLGVGPFLVHRHVRFDAFRYADGREVTDPSHFDHTAAFAAWGPIVLELGVIHSIDPALRAAYRAAPGTVGHVSWVVDDLVSETKRLTDAGCPLIHTAAIGAVQVAWHEGGLLFPHPIEVHQAGPPILGMHTRLADLARDWDGRDPLRPMPTPPSGGDP